MTKNNYIILTGAMGAGKSTVLRELRKRAYRCVDEPARQIIAEQRRCSGTGVPEKDPSFFTRLMLARLITEYAISDTLNEILFFDRAIPDMIAYADIFGLDIKEYQTAAEDLRYNKNVLYFKGERSIYVNDDERKVDFDFADDFGRKVKAIYEQLGYSVIEVPYLSPVERSDWIISNVPQII